MGTTASAEEHTKINVSQKPESSQKKDIIIGATEVIQEKMMNEYEAAKKLMETHTDRNEIREKGIMRELKSCILSGEKYSCYKSDYILYPATIDRLKGVGYDVNCIPMKNNQFGQSCTICWEKRVWSKTCTFDDDGW
jgi:hypothetical protein